MSNIAYVVDDVGVDYDPQLELESLGYTVNKVLLGDGVSATEIQNADAVYIDTESTPASASDWRDLDKPICYVGQGHTGGWAGLFSLSSRSDYSSGASTDDAGVHGDAEGHALAAGYTGTITIWTSSGNQRYVDDTDLASGVLHVLTNIGAGNTRRIMYAADTGATLWDVDASAYTAPNRRVQGIALRYADNFTATMDDIFAATAEWLAGAPESDDPENLQASISGSDVTLTWDASPSAVNDYAVHRRTPQTGEDFDPEDGSTEIARTGGTENYTDNNVTAGDYDYQVFGVTS